jgi:hypothetical protein
MLLSITFWICSYSFALLSMADKIVYLDRLDASNGKMWEPYFNPQEITANIGEQVHFVARLENIGVRYGTVIDRFDVVLMSSSHSHLSLGDLQNLTIRVLACIIKVNRTSLHI